jgi:hypothetical protein
MVYWQHIWPQILGTCGQIHNILFSYLTDVLQGCFCYISDKFWTVTLPQIELFQAAEDVNKAPVFGQLRNPTCLFDLASQCLLSSTRA